MTVLSDLSVKISADVGGYTSGIQQAERAQGGFLDSVSKSARGLQEFGSFGHQAMSVMDRMEISNMSVQNAMDGAANSQLRYNQAVKDYGENSQQAVIASRELENANRGVERANIRADMSFATMGLSMVGMIPQIISFGTIAVSSFTAATASVTAFGAALWAAAPWIAVIGVAIGGLYYLWQKNRDEVNANVTAMTAFDGATKATKISADGLRASVEKPVSRPSLMDAFNSISYTDAEGKLQHRNAGEIAKYNTPEGQNNRMFSNEVQGLMGLKTPVAVLPPAPSTPGYVNEGNIMGQLADARAKAKKDAIDALDDSKLSQSIREFLKQPRQIIVNATVDKSSNPLEIGRQIGLGVGNGIAQGNFKYAGGT